MIYAWLHKPSLPIHLARLEEIAKLGGYSKQDVLALHKIVVAINEENNEIIAFAGSTCYHGYWCLRCCVVHPKYRGRGIQRQFIRMRCKSIKDAGKKYVNVWISPRNCYSFNNAISEGFKLTNEKPRIFNKIEYFKLRKQLNYK